MVVCDSAPINPKEENSSNMNKSSVTTKEREETGFIKEKPTTKEVNNVKEEQDQSPWEKCSPNGSNTSSNVPVNHAHSPKADVLNEVQIFRKSSSVESGLDSLDESNISKIQGESNNDRLRRRIEYNWEMQWLFTEGSGGRKKRFWCCYKWSNVYDYKVTGGESNNIDGGSSIFSNDGGASRIW